jgi:dephospho-CoA kinase
MDQFILETSVFMLIIGLTGSIGSGKSTVAQLFQKYPIPIIDADAIARSLTQENTPAATAMFDYFGTRDRAMIRKAIFQDPKKRHWLNQLLHPLIRQEIQAQIKIQQLLHSLYIVLEIPLLFENHFQPMLDRILVVYSDEETQISRIIERDHNSVDEIKAILQTQWPLSQRLEQADDILYNQGAYADLEIQVNNLDSFYRQIAHQRL